MTIITTTANVRHSSETGHRATTTAAAPVRFGLVRSGLGLGVIAAAVNTAAAAAVRAAGLDVAIAGEPIPVNGFAVLTVIGAVLGIGIAAALRRWANQPARTFVRTCLALTALSVIPDIVADASVATRTFLAVTHVVAAAIIVPAIARRLAR